MRKTIINITAAMTFIIIGNVAFAQQPNLQPAPSAEAKNVVKPEKALTAEAPKQIVPGGEQKTDTYKPVLNAKQYPVETYQPIIPVVHKTAAKRPEVVEQNTADAQQKPKPTAQVVKEQ